MMNNIFNQFDPSSFKMSPTISIMIFLILTFYFKMSNNFPISFLNKILKTLLKDLKMNSMPKKSKNLNFPFIFMFLMITTLNFSALMPYSWNITSNFPFNTSTILLLWIPIFLFILLKKKKNFLTHLIPLNTPTPLIPFMFLIEMISFMIRPLTLNMRLTANMIAGHIMILLTSNLFMNFQSLFPLTSMIMMALTLMEIIVAILQSYIIITLMSLFFSEI